MIENNNQYTLDDNIFSSLDAKDIWIQDIFNFIKTNTLSKKIYYFQLVTRTTNGGKSEYLDFLGYRNKQDNKVLHINQLVKHFKTYGTVACLHLDEGKEETSIKIKLIDNQHIDNELEQSDITRVNHIKFNYTESNEINRIENMGNYLLNCLSAEKSNNMDDNYFLHYIAVSIGENTNETQKKAVSSPSYYGFGSALFFITKDEKPPKYLAYKLSYNLNIKLLSELIDSINTSDKQKNEALESNRLMIDEMKKVTEHVEKARAISNRIQAKLDNFGEVFSVWYQESMQKVFTTGEMSLGQLFYFDNGKKKFTKEQYSQHKIIGNKEDYYDYLARIIATTEEYFSPSKESEYAFIKTLLKRYENKEENHIEVIKKISEKEGYKKISLYFPIGLMLFFFYDEYYKDAIIDIENTDISHIAILNGMKKLFSYDEFDKEQIRLSCDEEKLQIKASLKNNGANKLFNKLVDFHNREPHPSRRTTTYMIRQLMGIDENNYNKESFAVHTYNRYKVGLTLSGNYLIEAFVEDDTFILEYKLKKASERPKA